MLINQRTTVEESEKNIEVNHVKECGYGKSIKLSELQLLGGISVWCAK